MKKIKTGSYFSGVGAFDQALNRLGIEQDNLFACDMDKHARKSYIANYGDPAYYPTDVYNRKIPSDSLDIYMTSPPCQSFSIAGKRKGETDKRGVLFYNSLEFIKVNNPRYFIFENVKGLLSDQKKKDDNIGKTFQNWLHLLGGKSVNGNAVIYPFDDSVPYHIYWKVLNAKHYGIPQNRERVFIIGIRDDSDNSFTWPKEIPLEKRLKDVLETNVDPKYYLSEKILETMYNHKERHKKKGNGFGINPKTGNEPYANAITTGINKIRSTDNFIKIGEIRGRNPENPTSRNAGDPTEQKLEINQNGTSNALTTVQKDNVVVEQYKIRKLTPREAFCLMDFPESFKFVCSDSQLYKQAGNSICVGVLAAIIGKLKL